MHLPDYFDRLYCAVDGYNDKFPNGNTPFRIITRLCEEAGELASAIDYTYRRLEGDGFIKDRTS